MDIVVQIGWFIALLIAPAAYDLPARIPPISQRPESSRLSDPDKFLGSDAYLRNGLLDSLERKSSGRVWAIIASLTYILIPSLAIWAKVHLSRPIRGCSVVMLVAGVTGLVVFSRRIIKYDLPGVDEANA